MSATEIAVSWAEVLQIERNGIITLYEVTYSPLESYHDRNSTFQNTSDLSIILTGLHEFANYSIQVRAYTNIGPGPNSNQQFERTNEAGIIESYVAKKKTPKPSMPTLCYSVKLCPLSSSTQDMQVLSKTTQSQSKPYPHVCY